MTEDEALAITLQYMTTFHVPVRDTYRVGSNLDDRTTNGAIGGPRLFKITWLETENFPQAKRKDIYPVEGCRSVAYDSFEILMPLRYQRNGRNDPIIHECVHFLQHNTIEEDGKYIRASQDSPLIDYLKYASQRVEREAHFVQVAYILQECREHTDMVLKPEELARAEGLLKKYKETQQSSAANELVAFSKQKGLI